MEKVIGTLPGVIRNDDGLYLGDLKHYFQVVFLRAQNLYHPYHNFRHMLHVLWLCYQACVFYSGSGLTRVGMRNLLIAALFHDFDHSGMSGNDDLNIVRALRGLEKNILPQDRGSFEEISGIIKATEYPYTIPADHLSCEQQIIRDADMSQAFSVAWIQQVVLGLAREWNKTPLEVLKLQEPFMKGLKFHTAWAKQLFPQLVMDQKINESRELFEILSEQPAL